MTQDELKDLVDREIANSQMDDESIDQCEARIAEALKGEPDVKTLFPVAVKLLLNDWPESD
jgi:hypothetical protein